MTSSFPLNGNNSSTILTVVQCQAKVYIHHVTFIWNFDNFDSYRRDNVDNSIESPTFSPATTDKFKWYLKLYPKIKNSNKIGLYLYYSTKSEVNKTLVRYSFSFLDSQQNLLKKFPRVLHEFSYNPGLNSWGRNNIPVNEVVSPDNSLNIVCDLTINEYSNNIVYRNRTVTTSIPTNVIAMIENSQPPDVVLVLTKNGKEYPAAKAILAARSPVFADIFKQGMERGEEIRRVNITDIDEQVVHELLKYIYTNKTGNIDKMARDLLIAANKFGLHDLKTSCIKEISKKLTIGNAVNTLLLADKHGFGDLKSNALRFIADNYDQVSNTADWKRMLKNNREIFPTGKLISHYKIKV